MCVLLRDFISISAEYRAVQPHRQAAAPRDVRPVCFDKVYAFADEFRKRIGIVRASAHSEQPRLSAAETSRSDKSFGSARRPNKPVVCAALTSASISLGRLGSSPMICKSELADATRAASTSPRPMMIVSSRQSAYRSVIRSCRSMV